MLCSVDFLACDPANTNTNFTRDFETTQGNSQAWNVEDACGALTAGVGAFLDCGPGGLIATASGEGSSQAESGATSSANGDDGAAALANAALQALEAVAEESGGASELPDLAASRSQLEAKFKHALDFGVTEPRGAAGFDAYAKAVESFVNDSSTVRTVGTYRGDPAILNYNPESRLVVVQSPSGEFISGWQMSEQQLLNVIERGSLGGG
jgi:hypothetical protein